MKPLQWAAVGLLLVPCVLGIGCGGSSSPQPTTSSGVPLPTDEERLLRDYYRQLLSTGTKPSVARCYEHQVSELPQQKLRAFALGEITGESLARLNARFYKECVPTGTSAVSSEVSDSQLEKTRVLLKEALKPLLDEEGASPEQIECVRHQIDALPLARLKELAAGGEGAVRISESILGQCGGVER
jgi:hypothetical protein